MDITLTQQFPCGEIVLGLSVTEQRPEFNEPAFNLLAAMTQHYVYDQFLCGLMESNDYHTTDGRSTATAVDLFHNGQTYVKFTLTVTYARGGIEVDLQQMLDAFMVDQAKDIIGEIDYALAPEPEPDHEGYQNAVRELAKSGDMNFTMERVRSLADQYHIPAADIGMLSIRVTHIPADKRPSLLGRIFG